MARKRPTVPEQKLKTLMQRLRERPELYERFAGILDAADPAAGSKGLDVHAVEARLRPVITATGRAALSEFAGRVEQAAAEEFKEQGAVQREKKTSGSKPSMEK